MMAMLSTPRALIRDTGAAAAAEMAMILPMLMILMFGSMELGNFFLAEHAVAKQVRDGARFASRMSLATTYSCPGAVFQDSAATTKIVNVTKTGSVDGSGDGRFASTFYSACTQGGAAVTVTIRCVSKDLYAGLYTGLAGDIPVVKVSAAVKYPSLFKMVGFNSTALCLRADSEAAVAGL